MLREKTDGLRDYGHHEAESAADECEAHGWKYLVSSTSGGLLDQPCDAIVFAGDGVTVLAKGAGRTFADALRSAMKSASVGAG
jgi:hypothetical protein